MCVGKPLDGGVALLEIAVIVTIGIAAVTFALLHYLQPSPASIVLGAKAQPEAE